jgi:hypothetical protein
VRNIIIENAPAVAAQISALNQFPAISFRETKGIIVPALILTIYDTEAPHKMHSGGPRAFNEVVLSFLEKNLP